MRRFERVLRRYQPPQGFKAEGLERYPADMQMSRVSWIERSAEQADPLARPFNRLNRARISQGRTCPLPRTRYL